MTSPHLWRSPPLPPWGLILGLSVGTGRPPLRPMSKGQEPPISGNQIVRFSHKKTECRSHPGQGVTESLQLPLRLETPALTHPQESPAPSCCGQTSHPPSTVSRAEATASRAAKVTSPAWCGRAQRSSSAWWLPSAVTVQSASSGGTAAPLMYQIASPTGTDSLSVQLN